MPFLSYVYQMKLYTLLIAISLIIISAGCKDNSSSFNNNNPLAFIGTYTQTEGHVDGKGVGISIYEPGANASDWNLLASFTDIINPSFLCLSPKLPIIYAVSEQGPQSPEPKSVIKVIRYNEKNYEMTEMQEVNALGDAPCYISTDREGLFLYVANYVSGNVVQYKINPDGSLQSGNSVKHYGSGSHPRQDGPHAHYIKQHPSTESIYAVDLGTNKVIRYSSDEGGLKLDGYINPEPDSGPRHLVWHPSGNNLYILNEITGTIEHWEWVDKYKKQHQIIPLNPAPGLKEAGSADIHISKDGRFLYASLRGDFNEIIVLSIQPESGELGIIQRVPAGGLAPRNFAISPSEEYLAVALQNSDKIVLFSRDINTGLLTKKSESVSVMTPVCIVYKEW